MKQTKTLDLYARSVLFAVLEHLLDLGTSGAKIKNLVREFSDSASLKSRSHHSIYAAVLGAWHREEALLDNEAKPKPLVLSGPWPSVASIVRRVSKGAPVKDTLRTMEELGLLHRTVGGRFLPCGDRVTIDSLHPVLIEHVANSLSRLLATVRYNTTKSVKDLPYIERYTHIPNLRIQDIEAFKKFSQQQGTSFLTNVEDWLESRRGRAHRTKSGEVTAGMHLIAFVDRPPGQATTRPPKPSVRRAHAKRA